MQNPRDIRGDSVRFASFLFCDKPSVNEPAGLFKSSDA
jgi:hypothetical protein